MKFSCRPTCQPLGRKDRQNSFTIFNWATWQTERVLTGDSSPAILPHPSDTTGSTGLCACCSDRTDSYWHTSITTSVQFIVACTPQVSTRGPWTASSDSRILQRVWVNAVSSLLHLFIQNLQHFGILFRSPFLQSQFHLMFIYLNSIKQINIDYSSQQWKRYSQWEAILICLNVITESPKHAL